MQLFLKYVSLTFIEKAQVIYFIRELRTGTNRHVEGTFGSDFTV